MAKEDYDPLRIIIVVEERTGSFGVESVAL